MSLRKNGHVFGFLASLLAVAVLSGCAGKAGSDSSAFYAAERPQGAEKVKYSTAEEEAFYSKGQIDRNLPDGALEDVAREYKYYLSRGRGGMCAVSKQSERYLAYARKVFRDKGMPEELANLAIIESGYKPGAVSSAGAAGAWQFMPSTGKIYGLTQDEWQDERLDPYRATEAAADYLAKLYADFGDWPMAIAAYNAGEGKLKRAKEGTGGKNFFEVKSRNDSLDEKAQLREETQRYVPKFLAVSKIMRNLPKLGFERIEPEKADAMLRYSVKPGTDLKELSRACKLNWEEFIENNRHHKRSITCTDKKTFVYVPAKAEKLASNYLCSDKTANYAGWRLMKVTAVNDSIEKMSKRSATPLAMLQAANPGMGKLSRGQLVLAPGGMSMAVAPEPKGNKNAKTGVAREHAVKADETLYAIAKKYNLSVSELMAYNGIENASRVRKGQALRIPGKTNSPVQGASSGKIGKRKTYVVKSKDNLWKIAQLHKVSVEELKRINGVDEKSLRPGATLIVEK